MKSRTKAPLSREQVDLLVKQHFGYDASCGNLIELTGGWFNTAYLVTIPARGIETVVKVAPDPATGVHTYEQHAMAIEVASAKLLRENTSIPVPEILGTGFDHAIIDRDYFFMQKLDGQPWNVLKKKLPKTVNLALQRQVAAYQRELNGLRGEWFGTLISGDDDTIVEKTWHAAFSRFMDWIFSDYDRFYVKVPRGWSQARDLLTRAKLIFDEVSEPRLVDWDLWEGNVFIAERGTGTPSITGIIDHERAFWGDYLMEFMFMSPKRYPAVVESYKGLIDFNLQPVQIRRAFYNLYFLLIIYLETYSRKYPVLFSISIRVYARVGFKHNLDKIKHLL